MANNASRDQNDVPTLLGVSSVDGTPTTVYVNPTTHRILVDNAGGGTGTVTGVSVATANGFAGTSDGDPTNPTLTLTTTVTGILKGNGTAISAGVAGDVNSILPTQATHSGQFLTTNGTTSSWGAVPSGITLQTNGTPNGSQTLLNLVAGTNITLTDNGTGSVTIAASGGGGGSNAFAWFVS